MAAAPAKAPCPALALARATRFHEGEAAKGVAIARKGGNPYIRPGIMDRAEHALESPCVNICLIDPGTRTCLGCGRTIAEIITWPEMTDAERRAVMAALPARLQSLENTKRPNV